ncbi:MAG TPA: BTAD domain-containing putative transcriptional regulator [Streptosporangiaceae bacterium]|nr:BTAD domain-containing putative transcriptional regulator [Streptosporangiaceae bacterium]
MEYRILGPVAAVDQGREVELGGPRERALLARLLLAANLVVPADTLAHDLWSGEPPEHATATLRVYISRLRRALGADAHQLVTQSPGYRLRIGPQQLDANRFAALVQVALGDLAGGRPEPAAAGLRQALGLWQGDPLADIADLPFARAEVARLSEARLTAIESRVEADLACGLHVAVAAELDGLVAGHPLREKLSGQRMLAMYRCGRQADALAAYAELRERLAAELGVDPSPELQQLHLAILRHEARPGIARGPRLPAQTTSFIGREAELATIAELLGLSRLVTLTGPSGSGKSRLALHAARDAQPKFRGGTWLIELAPVVQPDLVVFSVARALSVGETPSTALIDSIIAALRDSEALLVLDNSEHLLDAVASFVTAILRACPDLHILATSQSKLNVPGEATWPVPPLTLPPAGESDEQAIAAAESVRLFRDRARLARPGFMLTPAHALDVRDICRRLDGIPLAIELAAARVGALSTRQLSARLDDRFAVLTGGSPAGLPRHRTLAAAIEWSYELLSNAEQACLRRLALFPGGCTIDAAERVCADDQLPAAGVFDLVTTLIDRSLLTTEEHAGAMRYSMLESIRQYATGRLTPGERAATHRRQLAWLLGLAGQADLDGPDQATWLDTLDAERGNVRAALDWSLGAATADGGHEPELAMALAGAMAPFWAVRGPVAQGRDWLEAALAAAGEAADTRSRAIALDGAAQLATVQADYDAALGYQRESLAIWRDLGQPRKVARCLGDIGAIAHLRSDYVAARAMYAESIELAEQAGADTEVARCLSGLGRLALHQNDLPFAIACYEQSMARFTASGDLRRATLILGNLGVVALHAGDFERARDRLEQHLANARGLGDRKLVGGALTNLGMAFYYSGDFDNAGAAHEEALRLAQQHDDRRMQQVVLVNLGLVALARGQHAESIALHRRSLELAASFPEPRAIAECLEELAQAEAAAGNASRAAVLIGASEALRLTIGSPIPDSDKARFDQAAAASAMALGQGRFAELCQAGARMPTPEVIAFAQSDSP